MICSGLTTHQSMKVICIKRVYQLGAKPQILFYESIQHGSHELHPLDIFILLDALVLNYYHRITKCKIKKISSGYPLFSGADVANSLTQESITQIIYNTI